MHCATAGITCGGFAGLSAGKIQGNEGSNPPLSKIDSAKRIMVKLNPGGTALLSQEGSSANFDSSGVLQCRRKVRTDVGQPPRSLLSTFSAFCTRKAS
jgi:hypothetical protein